MLVTLVLSLALNADAPKAAAPDKAAVAKLQGKWKLTKVEHGGKAVTGKDVAGQFLEVVGTKATTRHEDEIKDETQIVGLDPRAKPATIDAKFTGGNDKGKVVVGIFKIAGDTLTFCINEPGKKERPEKFEGKEGTGYTMMVFEKVK